MVDKKWINERHVLLVSGTDGNGKERVKENRGREKGNVSENCGNVSGSRRGRNGKRSRR
jgi:hypothetical protein